MRAPLALLVIAACAELTTAQVPKQAVNGAIHPHGRLERTDFYDAPVPLPEGSAGTLIRSEEFDNYVLPSGIVATRILYHSRSAEGRDAPVSAVVLVPDAAAPAGGWPIIAWAHGTNGLGRECAPSLEENLGEGSYFAMYTKLGYAVVATDYAGLGTNGKAGYLNLEAHAQDVIYGVRAARAAVAKLGTKWIAVGEGEGGSVVTRVAELESKLNTGDYLGSIAIGGLRDAGDILKQAEPDPTAQILYMARGMKADVPEFDPSQILTIRGMQEYRKLSDSCIIPEGVETGGAKDMLKQDWKSDRSVRQFVAANRIGYEHAARPILVLASDSDATVPVSITRQTVARLCGQADAVLFYSLDSPSSKTLIGDSVNDQLAWIRGRLKQGPVATNCD
jgi:fermentation-respiration switch protein FrsA (DUF1100 family)